MPEMNICLIAYEFPPMVGGEGSYTYGLAKAILDWGHRVTVVTTDLHCESGASEENGFRIIRTPTVKLPTLKLFSFQNGAKRLIKDLSGKGHIDILHNTNDYCNVNISKRDTNIPIIATIHHPYATEKKIIKEKLGYTDSIHYYFYRRIDFLARIEKKICERVDSIIAVSNYTAKVLVEEYQVSPKKITVIPNAVDINRFNPKIDGHAIRVKLGLHSEPIILFVGRFDHTKGIEYLINAFSMLIKEISDAKLVLVGKGPLKKSLQLRLNNSALKKSVIFYGAASDKDLAYIYAASDVVVLPSLIEGFGIVLLEAMATAKPCVAAKAGGTEDAIENAVTGFFVPPADSKALFEKLLLLLKDKELSKKFGDASRKRVEKMFAWERVAQQTVGLYGKLFEINL